MSPADSSSAGLPTRSEIEDWPTQHLQDAASRWRSAATESESAFDQHRQNVAAPGGTEWAGDAKDAALDRVSADQRVVGQHAEIQNAAADIAENGVTDLKAAQRDVLDAIAEAEGDGFRVNEDRSVTDTRKIDLDTLAARRTAANEHAEAIRWYAERLVQTDALIGSQLQEKAAELEDIRFDREGDGQGLIQLVDNRFKLYPAEDGGEDPDGGYKPHPEYPDHKPNGEWGPGNSGLEGHAEAQKAFDERTRNTGIRIERELIWVYLTDPETGRTLRREYDGLEEVPGQPRRYVGLEHKLGNKDPTPHQKHFDDLVRGGIHARGTLRGEPIEVVDAELIRTPRPDTSAGAGDAGSSSGGAEAGGTSQQGRAPVEMRPNYPGWGTQLTPQQMIDSGDPALIAAGQELRRKMAEQGVIDPSGTA